MTQVGNDGSGCFVGEGLPCLLVSRTVLLLCEATGIYCNGCHWRTARVVRLPLLLWQLCWFFTDPFDRAVHCFGGRPGRGAAWQARTSCWIRGRASARPAPWGPSWLCSKRSLRWAPCHVVLSLYGTECRVSGCLCRRTVGHLVGLHQKVRVALF